MYSARCNSYCTAIEQASFVTHHASFVLYNYIVSNYGCEGKEYYFLILIIIVADQALKIWIKTHMPLSYSWDDYHTMLTRYDKGIRPLGWKNDWFQIYFVEMKAMPGDGSLEENGARWRLHYSPACRDFGVFYPQHHQKITTGALSFVPAYLCRTRKPDRQHVLRDDFEESTYTSVCQKFPLKGYSHPSREGSSDMLYSRLSVSHYPVWFPFVVQRV
jgi:signal peptidase II